MFLPTSGSLVASLAPLASASTSNDRLQGLVEDYPAAVRSGRAISRGNRRGEIPTSATIEQCRSILKDIFVPYADAMGLSNPADLTETALDGFVAYLKKKRCVRQEV